MEFTLKNAFEAFIVVWCIVTLVLMLLSWSDSSDVAKASIVMSSILVLYVGFISASPLVKDMFGNKLSQSIPWRRPSSMPEMPSLRAPMPPPRNVAYNNPDANKPEINENGF